MVLLFAWGTIAAFRPVRNADVWMHLRVAADIVATGEIPRIDQYSAVAPAGRPHLTHEWLSALFFLGIYKLGGGQALSVFRLNCAGHAAPAVVQPGEAGSQLYSHSSHTGTCGLYYSRKGVCATPCFYAAVFVHLGLFPGALAAGAPAALSDYPRPAADPLGEPAWGIHHRAGIRRNDDRDDGLSRIVPLLEKTKTICGLMWGRSRPWLPVWSRALSIRMACGWWNFPYYESGQRLYQTVCL